jgi:tetratricopeptide (TPR) repeat protein
MKKTRYLVTFFAAFSLGAGILPADPTAYWQSSLAAEKKNDYDQAVKDIYNFQAEGGERYLASVRSGWLMLLKNDYAKATGFYEAASKLNPSALAPYQGLAKIAYAQNDWKAVNAACASILRFDPGNYSALLLTSEASYKLGDFSTVIRYCTPLMNFYPEDPAPASLAAWAYLNKRDKRLAEILFKRVLLLSPDYAYAKQGLDICKVGKP